ncbi:MAG: hypothetical protein A2X45_15435 [Lentisphaerae bacterium GWF2_50_93]|nr:MAG: hypothetical protein A2X45_15435 [Lentisphaerae bacterium GWF2_50_93]
MADVAAAQQEQQAQDAQSQTQADPSQPSDQNQPQNTQDPSPILNPDSAPAVQNTDIAADATPVAAAIDPSASAAQSADPQVNVLVVSDSLENADTLFQSANSSTIVVKYDPKTTTSTELLQQITDALNGEEADSIGFVTDKAHDGAIELFADSDTSAQSLSSEAQQNFWNGVEGLLGENGKVNIFASDLASTENGRHLVDSLSQITNHQVAASTDVTGDADAGGNWELEYVAKGTGSVDLIDQYFDREAMQSFDHRIENPTEIAFIDSSVRSIDTIVSQLDSDVEIVYLSRDNAFNDITSYLEGRTDVDSISLISDADYTTGGFFLGNDVVNADFLATHQAELAAWGKSMSADGDIMIYGCNVAKDQVGKDLISQIATVTGADVAASTDITGLAGNWDLEYNVGQIQAQNFVINNYYHNLNTLTVRRLDDYNVTNPFEVTESNLTLREAVLIAADGDNIVFADYTVLHNANSSTPDTPIAAWRDGHVFLSSAIYHIHADGTVDYSLVATLTIKTNITIDGTILTPAWDDPVSKTHHNAVNNGVILNAASVTGLAPGVDPAPGIAGATFRNVVIDSQMNPDLTGVTLQHMYLYNGATSAGDSAIAAGNGGGLYITNNSSVLMSSVDVSGCRADYGGGIYNAGILKTEFVGGPGAMDIYGNNSNYSGGGVYNAGSGTITTLTWVYNNVAGEHGGGIYNAGDITVSGMDTTSLGQVKVYNNTALAGDGGGIYSSNGNITMSFVSVGDQLLGGNSAINGGGIYIFSNYQQATPMHFTFVNLYNNVASGNGGGLFLTNGNSTSTANVFEYEWSHVEGNSAAAGNGGGIYLFNNAGNILIATVITPYTEYNTQSSINANGAANGAGVYIQNCANVTIDFLNMSGNIATANGGAIMVKDSGTITLTDMEIASNSADLGGGIYYTNTTSGSLNVQRSNISNNDATTAGGGIYQANGILFIENDTLSFNGSATCLGGAIYMDYGNLNINFATLAYNSGIGAAIYIDGDAAAANKSVLTVKNSIIYNRDASTAAETFTSQIRLPAAAEITSTFSLTSNIYSHYGEDLLQNPLELPNRGYSLNLGDVSANKLIGGIKGSAESEYIESNIYLDDTLMYAANYRTMCLAVLSQDSIAYLTGSAGITYDQRGNVRGSTWTWDATKQTWTKVSGKYAIGAFEPLFHVEVDSKGDDSMLWFTGDENAHFFNSASGGTGLTLREAAYWIDTRATLKTYTDPVTLLNPLTGLYDSRYIGFDKTVFASTNSNNNIQLNYGQIEIGGRWSGTLWDSSGSKRDIAIGYLIRDVDQSGNLTAHDDTLRAKDDASRITVLAGNSGGGVNRLFMNTAGSALSVNNLTLSGGVGTQDGTQFSLDGFGGGIRNDAVLYLTNVVIQNCSTSGSGNVETASGGGLGGGLYNSSTGNAYVYDSSFLNNTVTCIRDNAKISVVSSGYGGGIANWGTIIIDRSQISGNLATGVTDIGDAMLGGGIFNIANMTITRSEITQNTVSGFTIDNGGVKGAGIANYGNLKIANSTIAENTLNTLSVAINRSVDEVTKLPLYSWGSYGSGIFNYGTSLISYYNTIMNNQTLVNDASFWNASTQKGNNLSSLAALYNADGSPLQLSNSILTGNKVVLSLNSPEVQQRADIYVRTFGDVVVDGAGDSDGCHNVIGAFNGPALESEYYYLPIDTPALPTINTPVYYELTYNGTTQVWTPVYEYVAILDASKPTVATGFDWSDVALNNTVGFYSLIAPSAQVDYLSINITTPTNIPTSLMQNPYVLAHALTTPFIYVEELDNGGVATGKWFRVNADGTFSYINTLNRASDPANLYEGLYLADKTTPYAFTTANTVYSVDVYTATQPGATTLIDSDPAHPYPGGTVPDTNNPRYGLVDNLNMEYTLAYNGGMTRSYRVLAGSVAMDTALNHGIIVANTFGFNDATYYTDQRGASRTNIDGDPTNIGAFDSLVAELVVGSTYDSATPRTGFDYTTYTPLWLSDTLTLREAVSLADDGSDITFKDTWQKNGTKYIADPAAPTVTTTVVNELDANGNLIINLVGGELYINRAIVGIDGVFSWNEVNAAGVITATHTGSIAQLKAGTNSRIFDIVTPSTSFDYSDIRISNMSMSGGNVTGNGGGIFSASNLTLNNVTIQNCTATAGASGTDGLGGAIFSDSGYLILTNSIISGNTASMGGGLYVSGRNAGSGYVLDVSGTSITGNTANNATNGRGGGVFLLSGDARFQFSTIGGNKAVSDGGGIFVNTTNVFDMSNSTVANNTAGRNGGGISFLADGTLNLDYTTIANNQSGWTIAGAASGNAFAFGGGIYMNSGTLNLTNSILAQNFCGKFNNATALSQSGSIESPAVALSSANQALGIHDDLSSNGINNLTTTVYGATAGTLNLIGGNKQVQAADWASFATTKLHDKLTDNGGRTKTVYVFNSAYFNIVGAAGGLDQTHLETFTARSTMGAYENSVSKVLYYVSGVIGAGSDSGSTWVSQNVPGTTLTEADGILNANNTIFVFDDGHYSMDTGAVSNLAGYAAGTTTIAVNGFAGAIAVGSYFTIAGDPNVHQVLSTVGGSTPTSITFSNALANAVVNTAVITFLNPALDHNWTVNGPDWTGKYTSHIALINDAHLVIAAHATGTTTPLALNGKIVVNDDDPSITPYLTETSTLEFQTTNLDSVKLSVAHTATSSTTVIYSSTASTQKVLAVDCVTGGAMEYDNLTLLGKTGTTLSTKTAYGPMNINEDLSVGNGTDNVKLNVLNVNGSGNADLQILRNPLDNARANAIHNFGEIVAGNINISNVTSGVTVDGGGSIKATQFMDLTNVIINTQKAITVSGGDLTMTNVSLIGPAGIMTASVSGDVYMNGLAMNLTNVTMTMGTGKKAYMGNAVLSTVNLHGNVTIGGTANSLVLGNASIMVDGLSNVINSKGGMDVSTLAWTAGRTIQVIDGVNGALKIDIGAQNLNITPAATNSTATLLNFGLDRLVINASNKFEIVTTGSVTSGAAAAAPGAINGTLGLSGKINLDNTFVDVVKPAATLELGGTILVQTNNLSTANSLVLSGLITVDKILVPGAITISSTSGSLTLANVGSFTGNKQDLTLNAATSVTLGTITSVKTLTVNAGTDIQLSKAITVGGDLNLSATGSILGAFKTISATGNILFTGDITLQDVTVTAGTGKFITINDNLTLDGNATVGSATSTIRLGNTIITAHSTNNTIYSKILDVSFTPWVGSINVDDSLGASSLKINISTQALKLTANTTNSTATLLNLGVDRLTVDANSTLEIATTNAAPITAASGAAASIAGTLVLTGKAIVDNNFTLTLNNSGILKFNGEVTIKKDAIGTNATISMPNSIVFVGNVKVDTGVTGAVFITSTNGDVSIGSDVATVAKYTGNNKDLTLTSTLGDVTVGNITMVRNLLVDAGIDINLCNSITVAGNVEFITANPNGVQVGKAYTTTARTVLAPIKITAGLAGTIGNVNNTGFEAAGGDGSELQLTAGSLVANSSNIGDVSLNRSLTLLKGNFASGDITLTANAANLITKAALNVTGDIDIQGNGKLENSVVLTVSGDIQLAGGASTSIINNLATGTINTATIHLLDTTFAGTLNNVGGFNVVGAINNPGGYAIGTTTINVNGFNGAIAVGSYITIAGDANTHKVISTVGGATPTSITFSTPLVSAIGDLTVVTRVVNTGVTSISVTGFTGPISVGSFVTIAGDATNHRVMSVVGGATPTSITISEGLKAPVAVDAAITVHAPASITNLGTINATGAVSLVGGKLTNSKTFAAASIANTFVGDLANSNYGNLTNSGIVAGGMTVTGNIDLISTGGLTNTGIISAADYNLEKGNLSNSKTFTSTGSITFADSGSLTNAGAMTVANDVTLVLKGALNNNTGSMTVGGDINMMDGTLTNKAGMTVSGAAGIQFTGKGSLINSSTLKTDVISMNDLDIVAPKTGNFTNSGTVLSKAGLGGVTDISLLNAGVLTNTGINMNVDSITLTGTAALNNNTGTITANTVSLVDGTLTNKSALNAGSITFTGTGNLINSKTIGGANIDVTLAGGSLTNTGTMTTVDVLSFNGFNTALAANSIIGDLNNNLGTLTASTVNLTNGTITNKAVLNANTITIGGTGSLLTSKTLKADGITLNGGNLVNSLTGTIADRGGVSTITLVGGTLTNSSTAANALVIDNLTLNGADLSSSKFLNVINTMTLSGPGTRNISIAGTATTANISLQSNTIMTQGKLTTTDFAFGAGTYFQMNNSTTGTSLEVIGTLTGCDLTHYFVTGGSSKVFVTASALTNSVFLTDSTSNLVMEVDVTGSSNKLVGISTFTPVTVNGLYNGIPVGSSTLASVVNRAWTITRTAGDASALTVKFFWDTATEQGSRLTDLNTKLFFSSGTSWGTSCGKGGAPGPDTNPLNTYGTYETDALINGGSYSVSMNPIVAMNDNSFRMQHIDDDLEEQFIDAIMSGREEVAEQQMVAEVQERAAVDSMFASMADRGRLMERNSLFKSEIDLGLEALLAV